MKTMYKYINVLLVAFLVAFSGCTKWNDPEPYTYPEMTPTMTIRQFKALYPGTPLTITDGTIILAGKVNSSDRAGNIYRSIFIEDETGGIEIKVGKTGLYNDYKEGQTIYVKPKYLCLGAYPAGSDYVSIGAVSVESNYETGYIDAQELINRTIIKGPLGAKVTPLEITPETKSLINTNNVGRLVILKNAVYSRPATTGLTTWAIKADTDKGIEADYGSHYFKVGTTDVQVRTSGYSDFADATVPTAGATCNITGILTKYRTYYQLTLLDISGVEVLQ